MKCVVLGCGYHGRGVAYEMAAADDVRTARIDARSFEEGNARLVRRETKTSFDGRFTLQTLGASHAVTSWGLLTVGTRPRTVPATGSTMDSALASLSKTRRRAGKGVCDAATYTLPMSAPSASTHRIACLGELIQIPPFATLTLLGWGRVLAGIIRLGTVAEANQEHSACSAMIRTGRRSHELSQEPHDRGDHVVTSEQLDIVVVLRKDAHAIAAHARTTEDRSSLHSVIRDRRACLRQVASRPAAAVAAPQRHHYFTSPIRFQRM